MILLWITSTRISRPTDVSLQLRTTSPYDASLRRSHYLLFFNKIPQKKYWFRKNCVISLITTRRHFPTKLSNLFLNLLLSTTKLSR
ncbi:unnamed protein product [Linum tenue]|uniref:Uncharacterized protein n=1 Tax=Linum tenue TaxID=586396 RepID=A0AAV0N3S7_9ROSI|nr:unnamed protein product [Linum tenue]